MATINDYAALSANVYNDSGAPSGWTRLPVSNYPNSNPENGFYAAAYQNDSSREVVVAFRGWNPGAMEAGDVQSVAQLYAGQEPGQYQDAQAFFDAVEAQYGDASVTGHSLGGALASLVAANETANEGNPTNATVFDAVPASGSLDDIGVTNGNFPNIKNYNAVFDPASNVTVFDQIGDVYTTLVNTFDDLPDWFEPFAVGLTWLLPIARLGKIALTAYYLIDQHNIDNLVSTHWTNAQRVARRDPLTLDLDGDGIETVGIDPNSPVMFDHDGDGIKNATGWVQSDDGFLVMDRNGNGTIDNGSELFGDSTPLSGGGNATDGFAALADQDSNGDGNVDSSDANFANLRVWRDLNQNGISEAGELTSLAANSIVSINTAKTQNSQTLPNGNQIADLGTFTYDDGRVHHMATVSNLADVNLAEDTFHRTFPDTLPISPAIQALPNMQGSGKLRDLWEAATQSSLLADALTTFASGSTRDAQMAVLDQLLSTWADTSGMAPSLHERANTSVVRYHAFGNVLRAANPDPITGGAGTDGAVGAHYYDPDLELNLTDEYKALINAWSHKVHVLEAFNGRYFFELPESPEFGASAVQGMSITIQSESGGGMTAPDAVRFLHISFLQAHLDLFNRSYEALRNSVYQSMFLQTRGKEMLDAIALDVNAAGEIVLDFSGMETLLNERLEQDARNGFYDLADLVNATGRDLAAAGWDMAGFVGQAILSIEDTAFGQTLLDDPRAADIYAGIFLFGTTVTDSYLATAGTGVGDLFGTAEADIILAGDGNDILYGGDQSDVLAGGSGNDGLLGQGGNDVLLGGRGNDTLAGGEGDDTLDGGADQDTILGEAGNDTLRGGAGTDSLQGGTGNDMLEGGAGNDLLYGGDGYTGSGNDTYVFNLGDGQDVITDGDTTVGNSDIIRFGAGITPAMLTFSGVANDLVIGYGSGDQITIRNWFESGDSKSARIENIEFADGTVQNLADRTDIINTFTGTAGNETLSGGSENNVLIGLDGNDGLIGRGGNDTLEGGNGGDVLYGGEGDDILDAGAGDDMLYGEAGNDTLRGGSGTDNLQGGTGNDTLEGGQGNDALYGGDGFGGTGNDTYVFNIGDGQDVITDGDATVGNIDTIRFGAGITAADIHYEGSYQDLIIRVGTGTDSITIKYWFQANDSKTYRIENLQFADGSVTNISNRTDLVAAVITTGDNNANTLTGSSANDLIYGLGGNDTLSGLAGGDALSGGDGNDGLYGGDGDDQLDGGTGDDNLQGQNGNDTVKGAAGNDLLFGQSGNDTLEGGVGNDTLYGGDGYGGAGNDTYIFNAGDGQDTITDYDTTVGNSDTIRFGAGITPAMLTINGVNNDLVIGYGSGDQITVKYWFNADTKYYRIENIEFADGTVQNISNRTDIINTLTGTAGNETLSGGSENNVLIGLDGNDTLLGRGGNDALDGGNGGDALYGGDGDDILDAGAGNDGLYGEAGNDTIKGGSGIDNLQGGIGNDVIEGGTGNDLLYGGDGYGGSGNDTYVFNSGDGQDSITDNDGTVGISDVIRFGAGITPAMLTFNGVNNDLVIGYGSGDQVTIKYWFQSGDSKSARIENLEFSDGTVQNISNRTDIINTLTGTNGNETLSGGSEMNVLIGLDGNDGLIGGGGNDTLDGGNGGDVLYGGIGDDLLDAGAGNDTLFGEAGNDTLRGGAGTDNLQGGSGNDTLEGGTGNDALYGGDGYGGSGNDTYVFNTGDGQDTITDYDVTVGNTDVIRFGAGIVQADVAVSRSGNNLVLNLGTDSLTVTNFFSATANEIERVSFNDGSFWNAATLKSMAGASAIMLTSSSPEAGRTEGEPISILPVLPTGDRMYAGGTPFFDESGGDRMYAGGTPAFDESAPIGERVAPVERTQPFPAIEDGRVYAGGTPYFDESAPIVDDAPLGIGERGEVSILPWIGGGDRMYAGGTPTFDESAPIGERVAPVERIQPFPVIEGDRVYTGGTPWFDEGASIDGKAYAQPVQTADVDRQVAQLVQAMSVFSADSGAAATLTLEPNPQDTQLVLTATA